MPTVFSMPAASWPLSGSVVRRYRHTLYEHQSRAMRNCHGEGPEPQLRRSYPRQHPRMAPVDEPEDAEPHDHETGADLDLLLPLDEGDQQREGKDHHEHCQQMADRQRPKCRQEGARTPFHQPG